MQRLSLFAARGIELLRIHSVHRHSGMAFTLILFRVLLFCFSFLGLLSTNQTHFLVILHLSHIQTRLRFVEAAKNSPRLCRAGAHQGV